MAISAFDVKQIAAGLGADICGIAPIERFTEAPRGFHPCDVLPECQSVIVFARRFLKSTLRAKSTVPYTTIRNELSNQMNWMGARMAQMLEDGGMVAVPEVLMF